jgi:hypothetical protein
MTRALLTLTASAVLLAACDSTTPENRVPTSLHLDVQTIALVQGDSTSVQLQVRDQHGNVFTEPPAGLTVQWSSSSPTVATVQQGKIRGNNAGEATITATSAGLQSASVQVTVTARVMNAKMNFTYSGTVAGSFAMDQNFHLHQGEPSTPSYGFTFYNTSFTPAGQDFIAEHQRSDGRYDVIYFWTDGTPVTGAGTRNIDGGILITGYNATTGGWDERYFLGGGTMQITSAANRQLQGTFEVNGVEEDDAPGTIAISGSFSLPLISEDDLILGSEGGASPAGLGTGPTSRGWGGFLNQR